MSLAHKHGPPLYLKREWCGGYFKYNGGKRKRWCSDAHKQAAWRDSNIVQPQQCKTHHNEKKAATHDCVDGFIQGEFVDGICNECGAKQAA